MGIITRILILSLLPMTAIAMPISYPGGWMVMQDNDFAANALSGTYSITAKDAVGVRAEYMRPEDAHLYTFTYNRLLARWNEENGRGNIYLLTGLGEGNRGDEHSAAASLGVAADWETRRYLLSYENRGIYSAHVETSYSQTTRVGLAPYEGGYDGVSSWLILQVDHRPDQRDPFVVTPLVRLFTSDVLGEFGVSSNKDILFNLMLQY